MRRFRILVAGAGILALGLPLSGCKKTNQYAPPPPSKVSVAKPLQRKITQYLYANGNTAAVAAVDLVARVQGFVQSISFKDGARVKAGDVLFTIEPAPYEAKLQQAEAAEASAKAQLDNAQINYNRQLSLQKHSVASVQNLDDARAQRDTAQANLVQAEANTRLAAINLSYTRVLAPFYGRMSAHLVSVGDFVGTQPTKLATIVQTNPIYVNFSIPEAEAQKIRARAIASGRIKETLHAIPVEIGVQSETGYPHRGHLDYVAPTVDSSTGTLAVRGILDNQDGSLMPGSFVRVRVALRTGVNVLMVPDVALGTDQGGRYVLVVEPNHQVREKHVRTGPLDGRLRVIESGLSPDDLVVIRGLQRAVPGQSVEPVTVPVTDAGR